MIVNETKNDLQNNLEATENLAGKQARLLMFVCAAAILCCGVLVLLLDLFLSEEEPDYVFPIVTFVLAALCFVFAIAYRAILRSILKRSMQGKEGVNTYTFTEDGYEVSTLLNDGTTGKTQGGYGAFTAVKEYRDMWLLSLNKATVFIVAKDGMREGTSEELTALLVNQCQSRYKVCYKNRRRES